MISLFGLELPASAQEADNDEVSNACVSDTRGPSTPPCEYAGDLSMVGLRPPNLEADIAKAIAAYTQAAAGAHNLQAWPFSVQTRDTSRPEAWSELSAPGTVVLPPPSSRLSLDLRNTVLCNATPRPNIQPPSLPQFPPNQFQAAPTPRRSRSVNELHRCLTSPRNTVPVLPQPRLATIPSQSHDVQMRARSSGRSSSTLLEATCLESRRPISARSGKGGSTSQGVMIWSGSSASVKPCISSQDCVSPRVPIMATSRSSSLVASAHAPRKQANIKESSRSDSLHISRDYGNIRRIRTNSVGGNIDNSRASTHTLARAPSEILRDIAPIKDKPPRISSYVGSHLCPPSRHEKAKLTSARSTSAPTRAHSDARLKTLRRPISSAFPVSSGEDQLLASVSQHTSALHRQSSSPFTIAV